MEWLVLEELIVKLFENSLVGGAFVYLLWYITKNFKEALDKNTEKLEVISDKLTHMDNRIAKLEEKEG